MTQPTQQPEPQQPDLAGEGARWRGHTHKELYLLLHEGPGAAASAEPSRRWQEISTSLSEIGQDLQKALEQSGAQWAGKAAGRAYDRLSITATWATETSASAAEMRTAVENQADHIAKARADMPPPEDVPAAQPDPAVAPAAQVAQAQTDLETPETAASSAEERAFEVMAAYELNTNTTTAAMATFDEPPKLIQRDEMHHGGGVGHHETRPSSITGGSQHHHEGRRPWHHHGGDRWQSPTSGSGSPWVEQQAPRGPAPAPTTAGPAPGGYNGAALNPMFGSNRDDRSRSSNRSAGGSSSGGPAPGGSSGSSSPGPAASPRAGATSMGSLPTTDMQAVAASQAAAAAQHAGAPVAPGAGAAPMGGQQDKLAMRRFGMEAIGSSQWFGDGDEPVVGQSPRRRRDFRESDEVTESVSVLDEEHKLPPNVIGDGHTNR